MAGDARDAIGSWSGTEVTMRMQDVQREIDRMTRLIVRKFHPERIILFGSHARGDAGPDSDIDLLVVMDVPGSKVDAAVSIGVALHRFRIPKDIIVVTPEEFAWRKDVIGTIEYPASREGKVLHASP
jgi:predicted nucleotidyltransferase